jgi:hypothetical protein
MKGENEMMTLDQNEVLENFKDAKNNKNILGDKNGNQQKGAAQ